MGLRNLVVLALTVFSMSACGGDSAVTPSASGSTSATPTTSGLSNGTMTATVDGSPWSASRFLIVQYQPGIAPFMVSGSDSQRNSKVISEMLANRAE